MQEWIKAKMCKIISHRACYGALMGVYLAGFLGVEKGVVYVAAALVYAALMLRG